MHQRSPDPALPWHRFPKRGLDAGTRLWRAARRAPWWYCSGGDCRFDLPWPRGTCYFGLDAVCGLLESVGAEWVSGRPLTAQFVTERTVYGIDLRAALSLADLVDRAAAGFRVTNELSTMTPYDIPREFAGLFDALGVAGLRYRARFDPGESARGIALFGPAGLHPDRADEEQPVDEGLLGELRKLGLVIEDPPALGELTVLDPG